MSISSTSICSLRSGSSGSSDRKATGDSTSQKSWWYEITGHVHLFPGPFEQFLKDLVPCSVPYTLDDDLSHAFDEYVPVQGQEVSGYSAVWSGNIGATFESNKLSFYNTHSVKFPFPFTAFTTQHAKTSPDISVSFPGETIQPGQMSWQRLSMVLEAKPSHKDDPFPREGEIHAKTVVQMSRNARNLLLAHGFLSSFVLGIYGDVARVTRFDHSSAIVSPPFSFKEQPRLLQQFFWHFTHPAAGGSVVGADPTVRNLTDLDKEWVAEQLKRAKVTDVDEELAEFYKGRRVDVPSGPDGATTPYINFRLLDANGRLFSRATTVWRSIEDTRISGPDGTLMDDPHRVEPPKVRIMKEAWRQLVRTSEATFYERLAAKIPESERIGLPRLVCGGDLGQLETFSWTIGIDKDRTYRERSHMRFIIDDVGRPLTSAKSTREVVSALRDAVRGHKLAWEKAGVLHRDVSLGNIFIVDGDDERRFVGFLHDFDYSSMTEVPPDEPDDLPLSEDPADSAFDGVTSTATFVIKDEQRKERTGTFYYLAIEILEGRVIHCVYHDLESIYWVLVWIVLRHTAHNFSVTDAQDVFVFGSDNRSAASKKHWLDPLVDRFDIPGNEPFVKLLREYAVLLIKNKGSKLAEPERLTYDVALELFTQVLDSPGWPECDFIPCKWFDARADEVIPGVTSDNHKDDPIPTPSFGVSMSAPQRSGAEMMPPPTASTSDYRLRSGSKRSNAAVDNQQTLTCTGQPSCDALQPGQLESCHIYKGTYDEFIDTFVPSSAPKTVPSLPLKSAFSTYKPNAGKMVRSKALLKGLKRIVSELPTPKKLAFLPNHHEQLLFPFEPIEHNHHPVFPDIAVSLPGHELTEVASWEHIATFIESRVHSRDDPFSKDGVKYNDALVQLANDARGLLTAHNLLAAFVIGIYGTKTRIICFDRSSVVASPPFFLKQRPDLLQKFLWRFVHPVAGDTIVGCDLASRKLTDAELRWVQERLQRAGEGSIQVAGLCRRSQVYTAHDGDEVPRSFFLLRPLSISARLLSRANTVWLAMEDPRKVIESDFSNQDDSDLELLIVKDARRRLAYRDEMTFYSRLERTILDADCIGLPRLVCGGDLGEREIAVRGGPNGMDMIPHESGHSEVPLSLPQQQAHTWKALTLAKSDADDSECSHIRFAIDTVDRPLPSFRSTCDLTLTLRDALKGHKLACEKGRVAPRVEEDGVVADPSDNLPMQQTVRGTRYFMAIELLTLPKAVHSVHHDVESFYWLFMYIVLRHTAHTHKLGRAACAGYFKFRSGGVSWMAMLSRCDWYYPRLDTEFVAVRDNAPLSHLLHTFKKLMYACFELMCRKPTPLNHGAVLGVFEEALEMEGRSPVGDDAIHSTPNLSGTGTHIENEVNSVKPGKRKERPDGSSSGAANSPKRLKAS
ncbi:hypothetical protein C8Q74DRAFT_1367019 [Fomes fomentarius]|nr:hypothetical protein C8Q74DRAFT_1367019 [Fomes fomentarius]